MPLTFLLRHRPEGARHRARLPRARRAALSRPTRCVSRGGDVIEAGCGGPIDLHMVLDVDPRIVLALDDYLATLGYDDDTEPEGTYHLDMYFNCGAASSEPARPADPGTDLAGVGGTTLPIGHRDRLHDAVTDAAVRRLTIMGRSAQPDRGGLGRDELCDVLEAAGRSQYLLDRVDARMAPPSPASRNSAQIPRMAVNPAR